MYQKVYLTQHLLLFSSSIHLSIIFVIHRLVVCRAATINQLATVKLIANYFHNQLISEYFFKEIKLKISDSSFLKVYIFWFISSSVTVN